MKILSKLCYFLSLGLIVSCGRKNERAPALFELQPDTGIHFENNVVDGRLDNSFLFRNFYNGGGVAVGDLNNDGLADVFMTSNLGENKLYINKGSFKFEDITKKAGIKQDSLWCTGVTFVDINSDGWLDIYVCSSGHMSTGYRKNKFYINNHDLTFTESAAKYGLDISAYTTQVSFFDFDNDGDLDCFMINNSPIPVNQLNYIANRDLPEDQWKIGGFLKGGGDHLYRNDNGHFTEITKQAGIHGSLISFGLGVSVGDINCDGWPDVYVSNDSYERDYLYINQKNGTFKDEFEQYFQHTSMSSMGTDIADINNDGYPDLFTTDMLPGDEYRLKTMGAFDNIDLFNNKIKSGLYYQYVQNCLQLNNRHGKFLEIANYGGVAATDWSWGELLFDADNDGYSDIYVCNGVNHDVTNLDFMDFFANEVYQKMVLTGKKEDVDQIVKKIPQTPILNKVFKNNGNLSFGDVGESWGFTQPSFSNGAAYADLDNDGDLDLIVNNENGPAFIYKNNAREINGNNYVGIFLTGKKENIFSIGSKIQVFASNQIFTREVVPSRGFQSSVEYKQIIGLGKIAKIDSVLVTWPDKTVSKFNLNEVNKVYFLDEASDTKQFSSVIPASTAIPTSNGQVLFDSIKSIFEKHQEDDFIDFYYERSIPKMLSREGPKACVGDVNDDGFDDIYIGGTKGHPGQLYIQKADGNFFKKAEPSFNQFADFEDEAVLFFDADGDKDLDLFVGPGGNDNPPYSRQMQNRLFINDGKGNFTININAFANNTNGVNTGSAIAFDFNHDGYEDLFVAGRSVPGIYGLPPASYLFLNDGKGHFADVLKEKNAALANIGMITSVALEDINGDGEKDLIVVGEWMPPRIFTVKNERFEEIKTNLGKLFGWWEKIKTVDVNADGKPDLVLGNIGENFYLRPDEKKPVKLWINDFDHNGTVEKILTRTVDGKDMPVFLKHEMEELLPSLKKQNLRHEQFANKAIRDLFPGDVVKQCIIDTFNYCSSIVAINNGNGNFTIQKLPVMQQFSSINAIESLDINHDGYPDLITGGNEHGFLPQFGRLDASFGNILFNNGKARTSASTGSEGDKDANDTVRQGNFSLVDQSKTGLMVDGVIRDIAVIRGTSKVKLLFLRNNDYPALYEVKNNK